jgi:hypothetical protein
MIVRRFLPPVSLCISVLFSNGCGSRARNVASLDMLVPPVVQCIKSNDDLRIPGTRLRVHDSGGLKTDSLHQTLYKDNLGSIRIIYSIGMQPNDSLENFLHNVDSLAQMGRHRVYYSGSFQLDSCPAQLYYLKSGVPGEDELTLSFGNEAFSVGESALFPASDIGARDSLLKVMLSVYMDGSTPAGVAAMEPFTLDVSHTEFLYSASQGRVFLYTVGGKSNPAFEAGQDQFFVTELLSRPGIPLRERGVGLLRRYAMAHIRILHFTTSRVFIREEETYELEGDIQFDNKNGKLFMVVMGAPERTLVLSALLYENVDQRLAEVIRIAQSLEFKNVMTN